MMPNAFKKLFSLFGIELKAADEINITIINDNRKYEIKGNVFNTDITKYTKQEKEEFISAIKKMKEEPSEDYLVIENKAYELIQTIPGLKEKFDEIKKFEGIITPEDYTALEDSIYIDYLSKKGLYVELSKRKNQIISRFGQRGNTICNLYTAGYFHGIFIPLYGELLKSENGIDEFKLIFDKLIRDFPLAIFINRYMSVDEVKLEIKNKIITNLKYGIKKLHIHGIDRINCNNIKEGIGLLQKENELPFKVTEMEERDNIILVTLEF